MRKPRPPTPTTTENPWNFLSTPHHRDSDASFCSGRPSTSSVNPSYRPSLIPTTEKSYQISAIRAINAFLASHSLTTTLKPPLPSAKDINDTLTFIVSRHTVTNTSQKPEDDLHPLLKSLNCPLKINKSALRPGTPQSWPNLLAVIHWLVQIMTYDEQMMSVGESHFEDNAMLVYALNSYIEYISGDDDAVQEMDEEMVGKLRQEMDAIGEGVKEVENNVRELEGNFEGLKSGPSELERLEKERGVLEEDVKKFHAMIEQLDGHIMTVEKVLEEKEKELKTKVGEIKRITEENEDLKRKVEEQGINLRDADRMKRELQAVERDIAQTEVARNAWEEKVWDLDSAIGHKFKAMEQLAMELNPAIRRLKLGNNFQYQLQSEGSSPAEVLGIDYKATLKPALASFAEDIKKSSMEKLEELISLQQQSVESAARKEAKRNRTSALQFHVEELEGQFNLIKKQKQNHTYRCATEARKMVEEIEAEERNVDMVEREAAEYLKTSKAQLQEISLQVEEEVQMCAHELFPLVDSVSKYKEYVASKIAELKNDLVKASGVVTDIYRGSLPMQFIEVCNDSQ